MAIPSIPPPDFALERLWIVLDFWKISKYHPSSIVGFPAGFHGFYVSNMKTIHRGMEDVGNPAGFFGD